MRKQSLDLDMMTSKEMQVKICKLSYSGSPGDYEKAARKRNKLFIWAQSS